jgi:uncharacterized protein with PhoU and TrkA domain
MNSHLGDLEVALRDGILLLSLRRCSTWTNPQARRPRTLGTGALASGGDKKIETVENVIRALNLLEQDGRIARGKAGIDDLVEICLIEKNEWIMWRSVGHEKWR